MIGYNNEKILDIKIDWVTVIIYFILVCFGWFSIYSSTYSGEDTVCYDYHYRYGMQLIWIGISILLSFIILMLDVRYFYDYSYLIYALTILLMILTLVVGKEVNGAKSWIGIGSFGIQSVELAKIGTAVALARLVSSYDFNAYSFKDLSISVVLIAVPFLLSLLQNDTGSALIFSVFAIALYREGLSKNLFLLAFVAVSLFVLSFIMDRTIIFVFIFMTMVLAFAISNRDYRNAIRYLAIVSLFTMILYLPLRYANLDSPFGTSLIISEILSVPIFIFYKKAYFKSKVWRWVLLGIFMMGCVYVVDFSFDNVLKPHQQVRILDLFGIQNDPKGASYNVTQSKIAIGSGGLMGKGFLQGTQTQYSYVPEQTTDFIFCTIGEEEGFLGTAMVVILFTILTFRLYYMGERSEDSYTRIYCYCVASLFLFHFAINIAMTIGLFPVIGIPLPFFSYGGSSMLSFSILLAIALKLDSKRKLDNF